MKLVIIVLVFSIVLLYVTKRWFDYVEMRDEIKNEDEDKIMFESRYVTSLYLHNSYGNGGFGFSNIHFIPKQEVTTSNVFHNNNGNKYALSMSSYVKLYDESNNVIVEFTNAKTD